MKRFISMLLAIVMVLALAAPALAETRFARSTAKTRLDAREGEPPVFKVEADKEVAYPGQTLTVTLSINGSYVGNEINVHVDYDTDVFEFVSMAKGDAALAIGALDNTMIVCQPVNNSLSIGAIYSTGTYSVTGALFTAVLRVKADAQPTTVAFEPVVAQFGYLPLGEQIDTPLDYTTENCTVEIKELEGVVLTAAASSESVKPGESFDITLSITGDYNAEKLELTQPFDSGFAELVSYTEGEVLTQAQENDALDATVTQKPKYIRIEIEGDGTSFSYTGTIVTLHFTLNAEPNAETYEFNPTLAMSDENGAGIQNTVFSTTVSVEHEPVVPRPVVFTTVASKKTLAYGENDEGEEFTVEFLISGTYEANTITWFFNYDPDLFELISAEQGEVLTAAKSLGGLVVTDEVGALSHPGRFGITVVMATDPLTAEGNIITATLKVRNGAMGSYAFTPTIEQFGNAPVGEEETPIDYSIVADDVAIVNAAVMYTVTIVDGPDDGYELIVYREDSFGEGGWILSGAQVPAGTVLKVSAYANPGYQLVEIPAESITVNSDITIEAAAAPCEYTLTFTHENGAAPTADKLNPITYGTVVTVTAGAADAGYKFIGWYQPNGKQLTTEETYSFTMVNDLTLEARYQKETLKTVTFISNNNVQKVFEGDSITEADFPADPTPYYGMEFDKWDKTVDEINAELANGDVIVTAVFKPKADLMTLKINNGKEDQPDQVYEESQWVAVEAIETVGEEKFAYWTLDGVLLTYNKTANFRIVKSCTLTAVYASEAPEATGTAQILSANYNDSLKKESFVAYLTVPEGAVINAAGLYAWAGDNYDPANPDYRKSSAAAIGTHGPVTYTWTKSSVNIGDVWHVQPYVMYTIDDDVVTVTGDTVRIVAGTDYDCAITGTAAIISTNYDAASKKAQFVAYLTVPEGAVIAKAGLVAAQASDSYDPANDVLTADNAQYVKVSALAVGESKPVTYTWTKTKVNEGDTWYARAYLVYTLNGTEYTLYGDLITFTAGN